MAEVCDNFQPGDAEEWTESDVRGKNAFAIRIKGDSMEPEFVAGDVVIVNPHIEAKPGDYVIVKNENNGRSHLKQPDGCPSRFTFHDSRPFGIVGKVVKKEKRY